MTNLVVLDGADNIFRRQKLMKKSKITKICTKYVHFYQICKNMYLYQNI